VLKAGSRVKTNVTLKIEADLLREVRIMAAEERTSISALLASRLVVSLTLTDCLLQARVRAIARLRRGFDLQWTPPLSRDELHER
jgi:hypothetical protein